MQPQQGLSVWSNSRSITGAALFTFVWLITGPALFTIIQRNCHPPKTKDTVDAHMLHQAPDASPINATEIKTDVRFFEIYDQAHRWHLSLTRWDGALNRHRTVGVSMTWPVLPSSMLRITLFKFWETKTM
jgi:hypothetical protein